MTLPAICRIITDLCTPDMAPPLLQLKDIALTFGGTPLLTGAELSVSAGERVCLVGRNGSGKSTLLKIAAGRSSRTAARCSCSPARRCAICRRSRISPTPPPTLAYVEAGLGPDDDAHQARYLLEQLGLNGSEDPAQLSGGEARRAALARVLAPAARHPAARRADQPSRPDHHRMAGARARRPPRRAGDDQPRPALPLQPVAQHGLARPRRDAAHRARLRRFRGAGATRCWRRRSATSTSSTARSSPRSIGCATASPARRKRNVKRLADLARRCARRGAPIAARPAARPSPRARPTPSGALVIEAKGIGKSLRRPRRSSRFLDPHPARRPHRHRRAERQRQDHADQTADRRARARTAAR